MDITALGKKDLSFFFEQCQRDGDIKEESAEFELLLFWLRSSPTRLSNIRQKSKAKKEGLPSVLGRL